MIVVADRPTPFTSNDNSILARDRNQANLPSAVRKFLRVFFSEHNFPTSENGFQPKYALDFLPRLVELHLSIRLGLSVHFGGFDPLYRCVHASFARGCTISFKKVFYADISELCEPTP